MRAHSPDAFGSGPPGPQPLEEILPEVDLTGRGYRHFSAQLDDRAHGLLTTGASKGCNPPTKGHPIRHKPGLCRTLTPHEDDIDVPSLLAHVLLTSSADQIGRASCRERV